LLDEEDGRELPECGEPAQPQNRVQSDLAARETKIGGGGIGHQHFRNLAARALADKFP
jgi:hypothetical protein